MKSKKKTVFIILFVLFVLIVIALIFCNNIYLSNKKIAENYYNNSNILNEYVKEFDKSSFLKNIDNYFGSEAIIDSSDNSRLLYEIPDNLQKKGVDCIEYYNNCLFFEFPSKGPYYNGLYYSGKGTPSEDCPIYSNDSQNEKYTFRQIRKGMYINGKKNSGIEWYKTEQINNNWFYYEVHL